MPPIQTSRWRQTLIDSGSWSRPLSTVAPVVVSPDIVSKYASVNEMPGRWKSSGSVAHAGRIGPAERHEQEAIARLQLAAVAPRRQQQRGADAGRDQQRKVVVLFGGLADRERKGERDQHRPGKDQDDVAEDVDDRKD